MQRNHIGVVQHGRLEPSGLCEGTFDGRGL